MSFESFHGWIGQHPDAALFAVFLVATAESLAVVGLAVPGVAMMFAAGALVGTGALPFWPICAAAVAGAVVGDGLSYWLGRHCRDRIAGLWPLNRHPELLAEGVAFFRHHGGKSVLLGRFVGPIRAIIPLVAGMLAMPPRRFLLVNLVSALLWGPAYLVPGMVFGASLDLAAAVAGRLTLVVTGLLGLFWATGWLSIRLYGFFRPRAHALILATFEFSRRHPVFGRLTLPILDPERRDYPGLLVWGLVLAALAGAVGLAAAPGAGLPVRAGWVQPAERIAAVLSRLGALPSVLVFVAVLALALVLAGQRIGAAHLVFGVGYALALGAFCRLGFDVPPLDPELLCAAVAYGFAAVLAADREGAGRSWLAYPVTAVLLAGIAAARIALAATEPPAAGFGLGLALAWLIPLGVAYRRHRAEDPPSGPAAWLAPLLAGAIGAGLWQAESGTTAPPQHPLVLAEQSWLSGDWQRLPAERESVLGREAQPLAIQWAGALEPIAALLRGLGWNQARPLTPATALTLLQPDAGAADLPIPPHFLGAEPDALRLIRPTPDGRLLLLRLWPAAAEVTPGPVPLWLGSVSFLEARGLPGLWQYAGETGDPEEAAERLAAELRTRRPVLSGYRESGRSVLLVPSRK